MASSITSPKFCPLPSRKVRVLGKIRGFTKFESLSPDSRPWINVSKHPEDASNKVTVSFSDQSSNASKKDASYELNECYHQNEDIDVLFTREIEPLISEVFKGRDASIFAYGARGSGKTASIQGMEDKPGLSMMAMAELLSKSRDFRKSVSLSIYEVFQEHAYDLLDPKHSEIQVLEDAHGRIKLKGLSQVSVESLSQFDEYRSRSLTNKTGQKIPFELPKRSHKVVVICISSMDEPSSINRGGKMNFVDLAGYEDTRRKSSDGNNLSESVRINKSLHAIMNVIYALNTNDNRVPFRESKLTRMLKESLGGANPILVLACMNPLFCQDTVHTVSVASRSCQNINRQLTDSAKKGSSSTRVKALSSQKIVRPSGTPKVVKKQVDSSRALFPTKKASSMSSGRKIKETKEIICNQAKSAKGDVSVKMIDNLQESTTAVTISQPELEEEKSPKGDVSVEMIDNLQESTTAVTILQPELEVVLHLQDPRNDSLTSSHMTLVSDEVCQHKSTVENEGGDVIYKDNGNNNLDATPVVTQDKSVPEHGNYNNDLSTLGSGSPLLSERLRELSNNLKLLCSSTPSRQKLLQESIPAVPIEVTEPKTPDTENRSMNVKYSSPWDAFSKGSSRMKNSLVQESLNFLNSASKRENQIIRRYKYLKAHETFTNLFWEEELQKLRGIGEKRATWILELREESPEPFKKLEDLTEIGLSAKQIKGMMKNVAGELFS